MNSPHDAEDETAIFFVYSPKRSRIVSRLSGRARNPQRLSQNHLQKGKNKRTMSMIVQIRLSQGWVTGRLLKDATSPIEFLKKAVREKFGDLVEIEKNQPSATDLTLRFSTGKMGGEIFSKEIKNLFVSHYDLDLDSSVITIEVKDADDGEAKRADTETDDESRSKKGNDLSDSNENGKQKKSEAADTRDKEDPEQNENERSTSDGGGNDPTAECLARIDALAGSEEFKALARELVQIAPQIIQNGTADIFSYQSFVFSINDGHGLTTCLSLLASLLSTLGIRRFYGVDAIEEKLPPKKDDRSDPFSDVLRVFRHGKDEDRVRILCLDISEWMNELNGREFKDFLAEVERHTADFIVVFRIPFVDKEVLERVRYSLNDLLFVRTVSFPPFTQSEIQQYAEKEFEKYGFQMSGSAWEGFHERISEERSDGKFYGLNTVKKVVRELLYKKQLDNAKRKKSDFCISKRDSLEICANRQNIGLSGYEMLDRLVGGAAFRERIDEIVSQIELARSEPGIQSPCIHMRFVGNPGTGKTTVARIVGKIFKEKGILRVGNFFEYAGRDFCGRYIGETAPKTASMCRDAYGSVLFIDEAYSLYRGDGDSRDYGREALDTLIAEMENHRSDLVVIMAGYTDDMEKLMAGNAGLASRMPYVIEFPNFTKDQLYEVFVSMLGKKIPYEEALLGAVKDYFDALPDTVIGSKEFSNARFVRNLFERTLAKASMRCQLAKIGKVTLTKDDFDRSIGDKEFSLIMKKKNKIGFVG